MDILLIIYPIATLLAAYGLPGTLGDTASKNRKNNVITVQLLTIYVLTFLLLLNTRD